MKILMIAPEPVFRRRGTPFSVRDRCRGLAELGHTVDLLTYPFGEDFRIPGVTIHRTRHFPGIRDVKIGFSWSKIPLDGLLFVKAFLALRRTRYDCIHTHEEAGMMGAILGARFKIPHLYDMHSSLPQQFENYGTTTARPVMAFMRWAERFILKRSQAIIAICPHLREIALEACPEAPVHVIENLALIDDEKPAPETVDAVRKENDLEGRFVIGYTGTFEINQGLDLLLDGFSRFSGKNPDPVLFLVGGTPEQIDAVRQHAGELRILEKCRFPGNQPVERMPEIMAVCDVLASPRKIGTNTPLKLYSYLKSGVPILATNLLTHTQVLDDRTAVLTEPTPDGIADGLQKLFGSPELRKELGAAAMEKERHHYSYSAYLKKLKSLLNTIDKETQ